MPSPINSLLFVAWTLHQVCCGVADSAPAIELLGAGATLPMSLYLDASFAYRFIQPSVEVTFAGSTGDSGLCRLTSFATECAAGDTKPPLFLDWASLTAPASPDMYVRYPDLQLYPTVAGAVVPIFNLNGATDLTLTMETLAKIWSGRITTWDHPDIVASNPNFTAWRVPANQRIALVARGDSAGPTQVFKRALAAVDAGFRAQVGTSAAPVWNGTTPALEVGLQLVVAHVLRTPYALGYSPLANAWASLVPVAKLDRAGVVVTASSTSVQYALLERGLAFGNNDDDPAHLTADLVNAVNPLAWPIVGYSYLAVRKATLRPNATCATVAALVDFWLWFWESSSVETLAVSLGFSVLPAVVKQQVVTRFQQDLRCNGTPVWREAAVPVVAGYGPGSADLLFKKFRAAYSLVNTSVAVNYTILGTGQDVAPFLEAGGFVVSTTPLSASANAVGLVLAAQAVVGVSRFVLTLDGRTLARILDGDITTWLHKDIVALNPNGIFDSAGAALNDTAQRIVLLQGPTARSGPLTALLQSYYPAYTGAAVQAAELFSNPDQFWSAVLGTPFAFSVSSWVGQLPQELQLTSIVARSGEAVAPSLATAQACANDAQYDPNTSVVSLALDNRSCYPLLLPLYISLRPQCPSPSPATARAVTFLQWMFNPTTLDAALDSLNLISLNTVSSQIQAHNTEALFQLACGVRSTPAPPTNLLPLLLGIIIPIVTILLLGVGGCGWWFWKVTEYNRMLRKKFSNDNVAESCAEAIARFDLQAVAWLQEVREPNKIQLAFLAIIALLTEVKPFIPDQLLSRLTSKPDMKAEAGDGEADKASAASSPMVPDTQRHGQGYDSYRRDPVRAASRTSGSDAPASPLSGRRIPNPNPNRKAPGQQSIASSDGAKRVLAMRDWRRQRCTYMCARFGSTYHHQERRLLTLVEVAGRIVDIAKANGATIDAVGVDVVNVHWGVTSSSCAAIRAVQAGLEIERLRATLPEDQRDAFWVQIGIGKGVCDCGTVSSESGHRFFVVWGAEPSLAIQIATTDLPKRVLTSLLVSPAVYQEVQYTVQCMPRLYHGHLLLWEPLCVLKKKEDDEWMYELRKINDGSVPFLEVFVLAKDKKSEMELSARVAELRRSHGDTLSPQDSASLDLLLSMTTGRPCCHHSLRLEEAAALPDV